MPDDQSSDMVPDALVRRVLGDPITARAWLQARLPEDVAQHLDFDTLQRVPGSFVDEVLKRSETDVLFEARPDTDQSVYVYIRVEHQSTVDFWLCLRLLRYHVRIWEWEQTQRPRDGVTAPRRGHSRRLAGTVSPKPFLGSGGGQGRSSHAAGG